VDLAHGRIAPPHGYAVRSERLRALPLDLGKEVPVKQWRAGTHLV